MALVPAYTIQHGSIEPGIELTKNGAVAVGEDGRGRSLVLVDPPTGSNVAAKNADGVYDYADRNALRCVETSRPGVVAALMIRDHSGYRGGWCLAEAPTGISDKGRLVPDAPVEATSLGVLVARGACAQGQAGQAGGGPEYLLLVRPGKFSVRRDGRLYGKPAVLTVTVAGDGEVTVEDARAEIEKSAAQSAW